MTHSNPDDAPPSQDSNSTERVICQGEHQIDGDTLVLREPFDLPYICILSGKDSQLSSCDITLRVKPYWWSTVLPIIGISLALAGLKVFDSWSNMNGGLGVRRLSSRLDLTFLAAYAVLWSILFSGMERLFTRKMLFRAYEAETGRLGIRKDLNRALMLTTIGFAFAAMFLLMFNGWFPSEIFPIFAFIVAFLAYAMTKSGSDPSKRLSAILMRDGSIRIYGLPPEFFEKCRLSKFDDTRSN
jgi:hypothetical protein